MTHQLPQWAIEEYARGRGKEAELAKMLLVAQAERDLLKAMAKQQLDINAALVEMCAERRDRQRIPFFTGYALFISAIGLCCFYSALVAASGLPMLYWGVMGFMAGAWLKERMG